MMEIRRRIISALFLLLAVTTNSKNASAFSIITPSNARAHSSVHSPSKTIPSSKTLPTLQRPKTTTSTTRSTELNALLDPSISLSLGSLTNDNIRQAFSVATFLPQPFWLLIILVPNTKFTKKIMGGMEVVTLFSLVHFFIVAASISQTDGTAPMAEFNDVFDPSGDPQGAMINMMRYPNFVSEEWSHVLTWDLFVGRWIWLDGLKRGIFTPHSVLLTNLIGPPGLLLHWVTCLVSGKGIVGNEVPGLND